MLYSDAILLRGTPGSTGLPASVLCNTVENVSLKVTREKAKAFNRNSPVKQYISTLAEVAIEITFPADSADTHLAAFRSCVINNTAIPVMLGNGSEALSSRWSAVMGVESLDDSEELEGIPMEKFALFPWAVGAAGPQPGFNA